MSNEFIDRLIDWKDFERFVNDLYAEDDQLHVRPKRNYMAVSIHRGA